MARFGKPRRDARQVALVAAGFLVLALTAGCAAPRGPALGEAITRAYPGHDEVQPKLAVGRDTAGFPYTPGALILAVASGGGTSPSWTAETDFRCGHATPISRLNAVRLRPYVIGTGAAASISSRERAQDWLSGTTGVSRASLAGVSSVRIALTNVRRIAPGPRQLETLTREAAEGCPLAAAVGWKPVKAVLIGDVRVEVRFERSFSLGARLEILRELQLSFGVGYERISDSAILGRQVAFGVQWQ
ncbi:MAG: hypothetical protein K2Y05_10300 [Hyphomicrobiaceae bacterium]|nr:hypothetical protein [Hyphomicrobiaceae bacterium]